jgi:hypothetical protein
MIPKSPASTEKKSAFTYETGITRKAFKIGIYGPEGIGKSSLAALCKGAKFADIEGSMKDIDVPKVNGVTDWATLREWVQSLTAGVYGIDSITRAEDWAVAHVIANKKSNDGLKASDSLEDFKYRAGLQFVTDEFNKLLGDIDAAERRGVSFIMVAHMRITKFKNPDESDFLRYEPRLIDDPKASNMLRWIQFLDHLAFVNMDISAVKGKATGGGSRTIMLDTAPNRLCKARGIPNDAIVFAEGNDELWQRLGVNK